MTKYLLEKKTKGSYVEGAGVSTYCHSSDDGDGNGKNVQGTL
jgi:hypothetical protein